MAGNDRESDCRADALAQEFAAADAPRKSCAQSVPILHFGTSTVSFERYSSKKSTISCWWQGCRGLSAGLRQRRGYHSGAFVRKARIEGDRERLMSLESSATESHP